MSEASPNRLLSLDTKDKRRLLEFFCPGRQYYHAFIIERRPGDQGPLWTWNGDWVKPTFSPSLLVNGSTEQRCHLFVRDGKIEYLSDCWHALRGQTVEMEEEADEQ